MTSSIGRSPLTEISLPGALVIVRHRTSLLLICRESGLNYFQPVVIAGHQLRPVTFVADFIHAGRLEVDVIDPSTGGTRTSSSNPEQQLIIVHVQADHNWPGPGGTRIVKELMFQQRIEPPGLGCSPGKPVQNVTALAVRLHQPLPNHDANQIVGNQLVPAPSLPWRPCRGLFPGLRFPAAGRPSKPGESRSVP